MVKEIRRPVDVPEDSGFVSIHARNQHLFLTDDQIGGVLSICVVDGTSQFFNLPRCASLTYVGVADHWLIVHEDDGTLEDGSTLDFGDLVAYDQEFKFVRKVEADLPNLADSIAVVETNLFVATAGGVLMVDLRGLEIVFSTDLQNGCRENMGSIAVVGEHLVVHDPNPNVGPSMILVFDMNGKLVRKFKVKQGGPRRGMAIWK